MSDKWKQPDLQKLESVGSKIAKNEDQIARLVNAASSKINLEQLKQEHVWNDVRSAINLTRAWVDGSYRKVSGRFLMALIGGLAYLVMPLDSLPDFIPGIGLVDDLAILGFVIRQFRAELDAFRAWENGLGKDDRGFVGSAVKDSELSNDLDKV